MKRPARSRVRGESGASAVELVLYMPILMFTILFAVQFSLVYLGGQVASGAAREAARTARVTGDARQAQGVGDRIVRDIDLLADMARDNLAGAALSITSLTPEISRTLEPRAPAARTAPRLARG